jgi:hypothetical protein
VQRAAQGPLQEYEYPVQLAAGERKRASCAVASELFEQAGPVGLQVEVFLRGGAADESALSVLYFRRSVLALVDGPDHFFADTPGRSVQLRAVPPVVAVPGLQLVCSYQQGPGALQAGPGALNASYETIPQLGSEGSVRCPLPTVSDPRLDQVWVSLEVRGAQPSPQASAVLTSDLRLWLKPRPRL